LKAMIKIVDKQRGISEDEDKFAEQCSAAELSQLARVLDVANQGEAEGPDQRAGNQIAHDGAEPQAPEDRHHDDRRQQDENHIQQVATMLLGLVHPFPPPRRDRNDRPSRFRQDSA